jgi:formylglycine-generating enzyme required for sulfatase activity
MVVIPGPVEFLMGSPATEPDRRDDELLHKTRVARTFAISATPVTREQFLRFNPKYANADSTRYPAPTCPIGGVLWTEAAAYCNWLSKQEGIPEDQWGYKINGDEVSLNAHYLSLTGYRLPTEAEMECAIRSGAKTSRCYGQTDDVLPKYAWYYKNTLGKRTFPVGTTKPNDFGLFDMHGNVLNWCQESYKPYPRTLDGEIVDDREDALKVVVSESRVLRAGSHSNVALYLRSAYRDSDTPTYSNPVVGFRPARTLMSP